MINTYIKSALRNLWKNKGFSFLNIFGLAIGITCAGFIFLWVEDELTFDDYYDNSENIYVVKNNQTYNGETYTFESTPGPLAAGIKADIPGIEKTSRASWEVSNLFTVGEKAIYEKGFYVDSSFVSIFGLKFIEGNAQNAFSQLYSLIISKSMAEKIFGTYQVLGKSIKVNNEQEYIISGVTEDLPDNVSVPFEWLASFKVYESDPKKNWLQNWGNNGVRTFVLTDSKANIASINAKMEGYILSKHEGAASRPFIYPMKKWWLYDEFENGKEVSGRIKYVKLFSTIAWIILLIACINFMNLSTARSEKRAREVGVRKVLGAGKGKLIFQFIVESLLLAFLSAFLAIGLMWLLLPAFNSLVEKELVLHLFKPLHFSALLAIALICGLVAGSYPAFYLSSFNPVGVLKGLKLKSGSAGFIRKGLVVAQFSISVILIISTIIIYQQMNFVMKRDLGLNINQMIYFKESGNIVPQFDRIRRDLLQTGFVENAALSQSVPMQLGSNTSGFKWDGKDPDKDILITIESVSPQYVSTMGMKITQGRDFYENANLDMENVVINEELAKIMGQKNVVGSVLSAFGENYTVVGVIKNFVYNNMYQSGAPLVLFSDTSNVRLMNVRFKKDIDLSKGLTAFQNVMAKDNPGFPPDFKFVDQEFERKFRTESLIGKLSGVFASLAILISCLGLFGLAAYTAERRVKEIGIRKVLGATSRGLAMLLSKDFLKLVAFACMIAFPIAWWLMNNWLQEYEYRIHISWFIFLLAGIIALLIALITVSFQAIKASIANPVKSLRSE